MRPSLTGAGLEELMRRMDAAMPVDPVVHLRLQIPFTDGRTLALVHALGRVYHSSASDNMMDLEADLPSSLARNLKQYALAMQE